MRRQDTKYRIRADGYQEIRGSGGRRIANNEHRMSNDEVEESA